MWRTIFEHFCPGRNKPNLLGNVLQNSGSDEHFHHYWNFVTPENAGKWACVEPKQGEKNWEKLDAMHAYAKEHGFPFKQHTFVWKHEPPWIKDLSPEKQEEAVIDWIRAYGKRYPDDEYIDVVNEPLHAPPCYKEALGGNGRTGWDWVIKSFEIARTFCPKSKLLLNEYFLWGKKKEVGRFIAIVRLLKKRGLIDGIGIQAHDFETVHPIRLWFMLTRLSRLGLPMHISELDINSDDDHLQLKLAHVLFYIFSHFHLIESVTLWGYKENKIWNKNAHFIKEDGKVRPALIWIRKEFKRH